MSEINLTKLLNENEEQYIWRIGQLIDAGYIENWKSVVDVINSELRGVDEVWRDESAYRKKYQIGKLMYENVFAEMVDEEYAKKVQKISDNLYKNKVQTYDQRREYRKLLTKEAREEHIFSELLKCANSLNESSPLTINSKVCNGKKEAILVFADWHYGMVTDNIWNKYNTDICKKRVEEYISKAINYIKINEVDKIHVVILGDLAHGSIHTGVRVASEEDACDQLMNVAEICAQAINELSKHARKVCVYSTYGNHMRTVQNKKDSKHSDNMEKVVPWWIKARFSGRDDIDVVEEAGYEEFLKFNVCGYGVCAVHGDLDNIKNFGVTANTIFTKLYGETIDYTISADKHHLEEFESFDIENIIVGSLCGTDDYARDHRLFSAPRQTLMIFSESEGRECTYNIKLKG